MNPLIKILMRLFPFLIQSSFGEVNFTRERFKVKGGGVGRGFAETSPFQGTCSGRMVVFPPGNFSSWARMKLACKSFYLSMYYAPKNSHRCTYNSLTRDQIQHNQRKSRKGTTSPSSNPRISFSIFLSAEYGDTVSIQRVTKIQQLAFGHKSQLCICAGVTGSLE